MLPSDGGLTVLQIRAAPKSTERRRTFDAAARNKPRQAYEEPSSPHLGLELRAAHRGLI